MKYLKLYLFIICILANTVATAAEFRLPGGGSIKYLQSIRIPFKPINVPPYSWVKLTCTLTSDGKSGYPTTMIQVKDFFGSGIGFIDGKKLNGGIGDVSTGKPSTFTGDFNVVKDVDFIEFVNLDKFDTVTVVPNSCVAVPY
ncbi:MAG: hypothetical protein ACYCQI_05870 [Gammaproteobacteria bacterium]